MLQHQTPSVQAAPTVGPLGVVAIEQVCALLGVSRSWLENIIRSDLSFPRPFRSGARRLVKFSDLQAWVEAKARAA
jgi:excisionase family DNA binding protein